MKLSELKTGERGVVVRVSGHGSFRKRILELGFIKGNVVKVILNAPLKDPIEYEIIGYKISLRREEADMIEVISESEAKESLGKPATSATVIAESCDEAEILSQRMKDLAEQRRHVIRVALVGNPNCGKTSLFNIASGSHEHVGNYSGVTVDAKEGNFEYGGYKFVIVDLPGTYSISGFSPEELYVRKNLVEETPDIIINVVDSSNLERNLYLTTQIIDMNLRVIMALNMYDELKAKGDELDITTLGHLLGMPLVPTVSKTGEGSADSQAHTYQPRHRAGTVHRQGETGHPEKRRYQIQVLDQIPGHQVSGKRQGDSRHHRLTSQQGRNHRHQVRRAETVRAADGDIHRVSHHRRQVCIRERRPGRDLQAGKNTEEAQICH